MLPVPRRLRVEVRDGSGNVLRLGHLPLVDICYEIWSVGLS